MQCISRDGRARKWASPGVKFNNAPHSPKMQKLSYLVENHLLGIPMPYVKIFGIGIKMTESWTIFICPYMDMYHTLICYFDLIMLNGYLNPIKPLKFTKLALSQFAILQKWNQRKSLRLLHFCIKTWPSCCKHLFDLITISSQGFFDFFRPYAYNGFANKIMHGILFASPLCTNEILANLRSKRLAKFQRKKSGIQRSYIKQYRELR